MAEQMNMTDAASFDRSDTPPPGSQSPLSVATFEANDKNQKADPHSPTPWMSDAAAFTDGCDEAQEQHGVFQGGNIYADEMNMPCACVSMNGTIVDANDSFCRLAGSADVSDIVNRKTILDYCFKEDLPHNLSVLQNLLLGQPDDAQPNQALLRAFVPGEENGMYMALTLQSCEVSPGEVQHWISCVLLEATAVHAHISAIIAAHQEQSN
jgi:hypothetical protein